MLRKDDDVFVVHQEDKDYHDVTTNFKDRSSCATRRNSHRSCLSKWRATWSRKNGSKRAVGLWVFTRDVPIDDLQDYRCRTSLYRPR